MDIKSRVEKIKSEFNVSSADMKKMAQSFKQAMEDGISGRPSSLKMLPSYIAKPTGKEKGSVIAIDFGGTNVRILQANLDGNGSFSINKKNVFPLKDSDGKYDYTSKDSTGEELFDYIAKHVSEMAVAGEMNSLGHTFSFPCAQKGINSAELIHWTKEIKTSGVEGRDICEILNASLKRQNVDNVVSRALINDTVGTLLAAAYSNADVDIASICGTGHNTCYLEPAHPLTGSPMIVNMESGNFDAVPVTAVDKKLDDMSERPGTQKLEKMASGHYLGEVFRILIETLAAENYLPVTPKLSESFAINGAHISALLSDSMELSATKSFASEMLSMNDLSSQQLAALKHIAEIVAERSARLVAATFAGTVMRIDPALMLKHVIAIDGSLYEKLPNYDANIQKALDEIFTGKAGFVSTTLAKDGSGIGAAIAAATVAG